MSEETVIVAEGLGKRFGPVQALAGVNVSVPAGSVLGLLGPNGAGKTTLVRILATLLRPDAGRAWVAGLDVVRQAAAVRRVIGLSGQFAAVDPYLTGRENLVMIGRLSHLGRAAARRRAEELLEVFELNQAAHRTARTYSGGMRRRLDVAASLVARPRVLFLDEPTTGLDPRSRLAVWQLLGELVADGTTVLLTTQYMQEADRLADQIAIIDTGRVIAQGTAAELKSRLGGDRLELQAPPGASVDRLADAVAGLGSGPPVRQDDGRIVLPVASGARVLPELAQRLAAADVAVADLTLRRPTLDDVFLSLTGRTTTPDPAQADPAQNTPHGTEGGPDNATPTRGDTP
jgi:ABC-2 type transport system ATP-binding protein